MLLTPGTLCELCLMLLTPGTLCELCFMLLTPGTLCELCFMLLTPGTLCELWNAHYKSLLLLSVTVKQKPATNSLQLKEIVSSANVVNLADEFGEVELAADSSVTELTQSIHKNLNDMKIVS